MPNDWIDEFLMHTAREPSPTIFRTWTAISILAGIVERRVHTYTIDEDKPIIPNLYVVLVGRPGRGKEIVNVAEKFFRQVNGVKKKKEEWLFMAPHDVSGASLVDCLEYSIHTKSMGDGRIEEYSYVSAFAEEMNVFFKAYDGAFFALLNRIWTNPSDYHYTRRTNKVDVTIKYPSFNILIGGQPKIMSQLLPEAAWEGGFTGRMIMVYSDEELVIKYFKKATEEEKAEKAARQEFLLSRLKQLTETRAQYYWEEDAAVMFSNWAEDGHEPKPDHHKLEHYCNRRAFQIGKLALISAISSGRREPVIMVADLQRAFDWLFNAEQRMPYIFRAMAGHSDKDIVEETARVCWEYMAKTKKNHVPESIIAESIGTQTTSDKVPGILKYMVQAAYIAEVSPGFYKPVARGGFVGAGETN